MRILIVAAVVFVLVAAQFCMAAGEGDTPASPEPVTFPEWGFSLEIPRPFQEQVVPPEGDGLSAKVFLSGDFAYVVRVLRIPAGALASTFIEQTIQAEIKPFRSDVTKRWEGDSIQGELFKGLTRPCKPEEDTTGSFEKVLQGKEGVICASYMLVKDESSPVVCVGVVAREEMKSQALTKARALATTLRKIAGRQEAEPTKPQPPAITLPSAPVPGVDTVPAIPSPGNPALDATGNVDGSAEGLDAPPMPVPPVPNATASKPGIAKPGVNRPKPPRIDRKTPTRTAPPKIATPPANPASVATPGAKPASVATPGVKPDTEKPKPKPARVLNKGEIELVGIVEFVSADKKSLNMLVDQVRMPGGKPITLDPARSKLVHAKELASGITEGSRVSVTGKNSGVGAPMKADAVDKLE